MWEILRHHNRKITVYFVFIMILWLCFKTDTKYKITPNDRNATYAKCRNWNVTGRDQRVLENETSSSKSSGASQPRERKSQPNKKATRPGIRKEE
jgi:hypothetical protein